MYAELEQKECSKCEKTKAISLFYKVAGGKRPRPECKSCTNSYHKKYRNTESGKTATRKARDVYHASPDNRLTNKQNKQQWARFKKYNITKVDFDIMLTAQRGKCKICPKLHKEVRNGLVVDHDHKTGKVRGLLCDSCNRGLGFFFDSEESLNNAANYLKSSRSAG